MQHKKTERNLVIIVLFIVAVFVVGILWGYSSSGDDAIMGNTSAENDDNLNNTDSDSNGKKGTADSNTYAGTLDSGTDYTPAFSAKSGFYDEAFELQITCADTEAVIYYTTDGSIPTEASEVYTDGIYLTNKTNEANVLSSITGANPGSDYVPTTNIIKGNVIRAVARLSDGTMTDVTSGTFFVGVNREEEYGTLPVISMYTDSDNLFDYETGIYVMGKYYDDWIDEDSSNQYKESWQIEGNFTQKGSDWEREAEIEYLTADGTEGFSQNVGIRIMGAASRRNSQKSFRIIARESYGKKNIKYSLIPDNEKSNGTGEVEKYKSFLLRNGGNDNDYAKLRDPFLQALVADRSFDTQASTPCVLFIDGEYWGLYALTEDYSDNYFANNYDIDNENIIYVKRGEIEDGEDEDIELFNEMMNYITGNDMSIAANYEKACELLDMHGFVEYLAFNLYINNQDSFFESNNWGMWRVRETDSSNEYADGRWRMACYDTEYSLGLYNEGSGSNTNNIKTQLQKAENAVGQAWTLGLVGSLLQNDNFKADLIITLCDMRNIDFEKENAAAVLQSLKELYEYAAPSTFERFGPEWVVKWNDPGEYFETKVSEISKYINGRYDCFIGLVQKAFDLEEAVSVTIDTTDLKIVSDDTAGDETTEKIVSDDTAGDVTAENLQEEATVYVNGAAIDPGEIFVGKYFTEYDIKLSIKLPEGCTLAGWDLDGCEIIGDLSENGDESTILVSLGTDSTIIPIIK